MVSTQLDSYFGIIEERVPPEGYKEAQILWEDCNRLEFSVKTDGEQRFLTIGLINTKHWTAIITYRELNIRIISVRRSRIEEVRLYEN